MADHVFTVSYEGPALTSGRMPVRELAPALLALSDVINAASRITAPDARPPGLAISATEVGSFRVVLHVTDPTFVERVVDLFSGDPVTAAVNGAQLVGVAVAGFTVVKWLKGRLIRTVDDDLPGSGQARITFDDGQTLDVPRPSLDLARDVDFRRAAKAVVDPLEQGVIDSISIDNQTASVSVGADDTDAFEVPDVAEEELVDTTSEAYLRLDTIAFGDNRKWKVSDGDLVYWVGISDISFLNRVQANEESFAAGDLMHVEMRTQQWNTAQGVKVERTITRVIDHRAAPRQVPLPFEHNDE